MSRVVKFRVIQRRLESGRFKKKYSQTYTLYISKTSYKYDVSCSKYRI